jgi:hypothetical protein
LIELGIDFTLRVVTLGDAGADPLGDVEANAVGETAASAVDATALEPSMASTH